MKDIKKVNAGEIILTAIMFGWIVIALLAGGHLLGILQVPGKALHYVGGALIAYVFVGFITITHLCVKFMLKKG